MRREESHIPDDELLQMLDGELDVRRATAVNSHLAACWQCRTRRSEIEGTIADFMQVYPGFVDLPPSNHARNSFQARLRELAVSARPSLWERSLQAFWLMRRYAQPGLMALAAVAVVLAIHFLLPGAEASARPNSRLTPGVARAISREELCTSPDSDALHPVSDRMAFRVFDKYGIHDPQPRTYEVDYLITPELGGLEDVRNLWPEPYAAGVWNAHVKDALEDRLHELVCSGKLDLSTAQQDIATNWIEAYKKYFHTENPLQLHASFSRDAPWQ